MHPLATLRRSCLRLARPHLAALGLGLCYSALLIAAFDPFSIWPLAFLLPLPIALASALGDRGRAAAWATVGSIPGWGWLSAWMWGVSPAGMPLLVLHHALYTALLIWLLSALRRWLPSVGMSLGLSVVWVGVEVLRGEVLWDGYPWYLIAHPLIDADPLQSPAAVGGVYLVSILVAACAGIVADALRRRPAGQGPGYLGQQITVGVLVAFVWIGSALRPDAVPTGTVRLAAVQTNVPASNKVAWSLDQRVADFRDFVALTRQAADVEGVEAVVWPETMFPGDTLDPASLATERAARLAWPITNADGSQARLESTALADALLGLQSELGIPMVIGDTAYTNFRIERDAEGYIRYNFDHAYNSAFVLDAGQIREPRYDKLLLTPFGEVMPGISSLPWLERALLAIGAGGMAFDLDAGHTPTLLTLPRADGPDLRIAAPICFEVTASRVLRALVYAPDGSRRADLIVNLSNDGWFGSFDRTRAHHLRAARWRCVETGTGMFRSVNTGTSTAIDARGRVIATLAPREAGVLVADLPIMPGETPFARVGNAPGWACFWVASALALLVLLLDLRRDEPTDARS